MAVIPGHASIFRADKDCPLLWNFVDQLILAVSFHCFSNLRMEVKSHKIHQKEQFLVCRALVSIVLHGACGLLVCSLNWINYYWNKKGEIWGMTPYIDGGHSKSLGGMWDATGMYWRLGHETADHGPTLLN